LPPLAEVRDVQKAPFNAKPSDAKLWGLPKSCGFYWSSLL
jgi:hypothetical protein